MLIVHRVHIGRRHIGTWRRWGHSRHHRLAQLSTPFNQRKGGNSLVQGNKEDKHKRIHESAGWRPAEQNPLRKTEAALVVLGEPYVVTAAGREYSASGTYAHIVCHCRATSRLIMKLDVGCGVIIVDSQTAAASATLWYLNGLKSSLIWTGVFFGT